MKNKLDTEIIFQVRIDRIEKNFDMVKVALDNFEQGAFEAFLEAYLDEMKQIRQEDLEFKIHGSEEE